MIPGRSIVIVVNKWDGLDNRKRNRIIRDIESKFSFLPGPELVTISALHGSNIREVIPAANRAYDSAMVSIATSSLNRVLAEAIVQTPPPMNNQRPVKLKFAHQAGRNPPVIIIHGNQVDSLPKSYLRYLSRYFSNAYGLTGTPLRILTRVSENPFKRRNPSKKEFQGSNVRQEKTVAGQRLSAVTLNRPLETEMLRASPGLTCSGLVITLLSIFCAMA